MNEHITDLLLLGLILLPAICGALLLGTAETMRRSRTALLLLSAAGNLALALALYGRELSFNRPWCGWGLDFALKLYHFNGFILLSTAAVSLLTAIYTASLAQGKPYTRMLYSGMSFTLALVNGAVLANNLVVMLFFWEAILVTMFMMIASGGKNAYRTATKAVVIAGLTDLSMMLGIGLTGYLARTLAMDEIRLPLHSWGLVAFVLLAIGALSKVGAMPFHTWIPDAADDAPTPFMPFLPGALEKLLGIYLLSRLCLDLFELEHGSAASLALMTLGALTIICAVMMALIQRDFKRLLSYHAVSQVGYMILGLGTATPAGIVGGLFHMLNNAIYKCCLFQVAGAVERQTGSSDLNKLGGLRKRMPLTAFCFIIAAASIAGFPLSNGFYSKELIFDGALESGLIYYIIAAIGAFFTPISFLKLGHAVFFGPTTKATAKAKEAPRAMLLPMLILALACIGLGIGSAALIDRVLQPALGASAAEAHLSGHTNWLLASISAALLALAAVDHYLGFKRTGKGLEAADHFHHAPILSTIYNLAERKYFDPYEMARPLITGYADLSLMINDGINWIYDVLSVAAIQALAILLKRAHNGNQARYVAWAVGGVALVVTLYLI